MIVTRKHGSIEIGYKQLLQIITVYLLSYPYHNANKIY